MPLYWRPQNHSIGSCEEHHPGDVDDAGPSQAAAREAGPSANPLSHTAAGRAGGAGGDAERVVEGTFVAAGRAGVFAEIPLRGPGVELRATAGGSRGSHGPPAGPDVGPERGVLGLCEDPELLRTAQLMRAGRRPESSK